MAKQITNHVSWVGKVDWEMTPFQLIMLLAGIRKLVAPLIARQISALYCNISLNVPSIWCYVACVTVPMIAVIIVIVWLVTLSVSTRVW